MKMDNFSSLFFVAFLIMLMPTFMEARAQQGAAYRYKLDVGNPNNYCPRRNFICEDEKIHYFCAKNDSGRNRDCKCFSKKRLTPKLIRIFVQGHNGIRNKVAGAFGIANMNLVYWSEHLGTMAEKFLEECLLGEDPCKVIGDKYIEVAQNSVYTLGRLMNRWPGRIVRHWYKEIGYESRTYQDFLAKYATKKIGNFTNMIWPLTEFIGCGAARMYKGFFVVCFYYPPFNETVFEGSFRFGPVCTHCSPDRTVCSKTFSGLCGVDFDFGAAADLSIHNCLLNFLIMSLVLFVIDFLNSLYR